MNRVFIMVGIPGSGKTTEAMKIEELFSADYICPDDIRAELCGDATDQTKNKEVWDTAYKRFEWSINAKHDVIFDATNIYREGRKKLLNIVGHDEDIKKICVFVNTEYPKCLQRNKNRQRVVPEDVLYRMKNELQKPYIREGFDKVVAVFN